MPGLICIATCENFASEVASVLKTEDWPDVAALHFPARCGRTRLDWHVLHGLLPVGAQHLVLLGRACLAGLGSPPPGFPSTQAVSLQQCFHMIAGRALVDEAIDQGAYLVTPSWLENWRGHVAALGFGTDGAAELFREVARELVLLDTGLDPQSPALLADLSAAVGLPARRVVVGLDHLRLSLSRLVLEHRLADARAGGEVMRRRHAAELADQLAAMDLLFRVVQARDEPDAVAAIGELFQMLFGSGAQHYVRFEGQVPLSDQPIPPTLLQQMGSLASDYACTPTGDGFLLRIQHDGATLGVVAIEQLAFPAYRDRYLNLARTLSGVCGLAIANARKRRRLVDAEKMSSHSHLVAGVAHEINTPLGAVLAAASALPGDSRQLAAGHAESTMTQADLDRYLASAEGATSPVLRNLEHIGRLVDTFRSVAVDGLARQRRLLRVRDVIDETLAAFRDELRERRVEVRLECDPALEISSYAGDWAEITRNLVANSLRHGFRDCERGRIDIVIATTGSHLHYEYRDGTIHCEGQPGLGVRFTVIVPLAGLQEAA